MKSQNKPKSEGKKPKKNSTSEFQILNNKKNKKKKK